MQCPFCTKIVLNTRVQQAKARLAQQGKELEELWRKQLLMTAASKGEDGDAAVLNRLFKA